MKAELAATSPQVLRQINTDTVLRFALAGTIFSATDVMAATGLTRSTVLGVCEDLIELGWIDRQGDARTAGEYSKGRPAMRYALRAKSGFFIGVDAGQHSVTAVVADLRGDVLSRVRVSLGEEGSDPELRLRVTRSAVDAALLEAGAAAAAVFATVIGVPAPTDESGNSPAGNGGYWAKMNPGFSTQFPGPGRVLVENDANLAAIAEQSIGAGIGSRSFAALLCGERFGAGLIVDGTLLRGSHGGAGELRILDLVEGVGSADGIGALAREWAQAVVSTGKPPVKSALARVKRADLTAAHVFAAAAAGDRTSLKIVSRLGERLARVCVVLASLLDVDRVILVGAIAEASGPVIAEARLALQSDLYAPVPELVASALGADTVVLGAIQRGISLMRESPLRFTPA